MILLELVARNVSAALRETANAAVAMECRQVLLMKHEKDWSFFKEECEKHDLIRSDLASLMGRLESIQGRLKELKDF